MKFKTESFTEIPEPEFGNQSFVISKNRDGLYTASTMLFIPQVETIRGESDPFELSDNTPMEAFCQQAYERLIVNAREIAIDET